MKIVLASNNPGKLAELRGLLPHWAEVTSAGEMGVKLPEETGTTFEENAFLKAHAVTSFTRQVAVADDSGLEVDALHGAPGVRSARFAGEPSDDEKNNALLLLRLEGVNPPNRTARFRSVVAVVSPHGEAFSAAGAIEGHILLSPRGGGGFGYDPLFVPIGSTQTLAELSLDRKNQISHRAVAFRGVAKKLLALLETYQSYNSVGTSCPTCASRKYQ